MGMTAILVKFQVYGCNSYHRIIGPVNTYLRPGVIILSNYDGLESQMLHTKFRENRPAGSGEEDF